MPGRRVGYVLSIPETGIPETMGTICLGILLLFASDPLASHQPSNPTDLTSLRAAHDAARRTVRESEGGHRAFHPGQRWVTDFDGRGFAITPEHGDWSWGLELSSFGFLGAEQAMEALAPRVRAEGSRVAYAWSASLDEWFENEARGLEHGFTVHARPAGNEVPDRPLSFVLAVRGDLRAKTVAGGRGLEWIDEGGATRLTYDGLHVYDADGRELPARFESAGARVRLLVQERGARYPLTVDPIVQQAYLKASNTGVQDYFGIAVAISGDTAVVGAPLEDSGATGVDGDPNDNGAPDSGAAYVFVRDGTSWIQQAYLKASNTGANDQFGSAVAISGDTVVVGSSREASASTGVDGDPMDDGAPLSGAVYVFARSSATWSQEAYLKASNAQAGDEFGRSVSVSSDTVVVGAPGEDSNATGVDGDPNNNAAVDSGAVYVFVRSGATWTQEAYVKALETGPHDRFGRSVSVSGDTLAVGADLEDGSSTGVNGDASNNGAANSGAAYAFVRIGTTWSQEAYFKASNPDPQDLFGNSVSIAGDTLVVGAYAEDSSATGVDGDSSDNGASLSGAAYVFVRNGAGWSQEAYLKASNAELDDLFGGSVAASGDTVLVGAVREDSRATGIDGDETDNSRPQSGAAYVFRRDGSVWSQIAYLKASNTGFEDSFGVSVALSGSTALVGAYGEDSSATGVNGNQESNATTDSGAAYLFDFDAPDPFDVPVCFGDGSASPCGCDNEAAPGSGGGCSNGPPMPAGQGAVLSASGSNSVSADDLVLTVDYTTNQPGLFFQADNAILGGSGVGFGDGIRCCGGNVVRLELANPHGGPGPKTVSTMKPILGTAPPGSTTPGDTRCYQWWYRNPGTSSCGANFNLSNALLVTWSF